MVRPPERPVRSADAASSNAPCSPHVGPMSDRLDLANYLPYLVNRIIPLAHRLETSAGAGIPASDLAVVKRVLRRMFENMAGH